MNEPPTWSEHLLTKALQADRHCVVLAQQAKWSHAVSWPLIGVSRLGDGILWAAVMLLLPWIDHESGTQRTLQLLALGSLNVGLYVWLKLRVARPDRKSVV